MSLQSTIDNLINLEPEPVVDSVQVFIDDCLVPSKGCVALGIVHRAHLAYCANNNLVPVPMCFFGPKLRDKGFLVTIGRGNKFWVRGHSLIQK
jgi:hypothetical protein